MPTSNYPQGFAQGLQVRGLPLLQAQPGQIFWVGNNPNVLPGCVGGADGNPGTYQQPMATLDYAISRCAQNTGDIVMVKQGHRELISNATTLALDTAGVAVIGLGSGVLRPTFSLDTATTANIPVRAAGCAVQNCAFEANFADIASMFTGISASVTASIALTTLTVTVVGSGTVYPGASVMGTGVVPGTVILSQLSGTTGGVGTYQVNNSQTFASGTITTGNKAFALEQCYFYDRASNLNALTVYTSSASVQASEGFRFQRNNVRSLGITAATTALKISVDTTDIVIGDNNGVSAVLNDTAAVLAAGTAQLTSFFLERNRWTRPNTSSIGGSFVSGSGNAWSGMASDNYFWQADATSGIWIATGHGTAFGYQNNYSPITGTTDISGLINPAAA